MGLTAATVVIGKLIVLGGLTSAAAWDLSSRTIPNMLVLTVGGGGLIVRLMGAERHTIWASVAAAAVLFGGLRLLTSVGMVGGGDAKLIAAVALGQPAASVPAILTSIALAGGVLASFYLFRDRARRRHGRQAVPISEGLTEMPYAPAILAGVVWHELWSNKAKIGEGAPDHTFGIGIKEIGHGRRRGLAQYRRGWVDRKGVRQIEARHGG